MKPARAASLCLALLAACAAPSSAAPALAKVVVMCSFTRLFQIASNQIAIWIEDEHGAFIRTLFVSNFAGRRAGWKSRPQVTPTWVKASSAAGTPQAAIDAVSGATPSNGTVTAIWDLKDAAGAPVPEGDYRYRIEGNISWEKTVLWTGTIHVGRDRQTSQATAVYSVADESLTGKLIGSASAEYVPGG